MNIYVGACCPGHGGVQMRPTGAGGGGQEHPPEGGDRRGPVHCYGICIDVFMFMYVNVGYIEDVYF